jgi:hypothetical protein
MQSTVCQSVSLEGSIEIMNKISGIFETLPDQKNNL